MEILKSIIKHFWLFIIIIVAFTLIGVVLAFTLPRRYTATALVFPPTVQDIYPVSGISQMYLSEWGVTGGLLTGTSLSDVFIGVMKSGAIKEKVIEECHLRERFGEEAFQKLTKMTDLSVTREMLISIKVHSKDPELAAKIANSYLDNLDRFMKNTLMTKGKQIRIFLENRLKEEKEKLKKLLHESERASFPYISSKYTEKVGELEANIQIYNFLLQQYEQAKIMEVQNTPVVTVIQRAKPPKYPSWPNKPVIVTIMFVLGLVAATFIVIIIDKFSEIKKEIKDVRKSSK